MAGSQILTILVSVEMMWRCAVLTEEWYLMSTMGQPYRWSFIWTGCDDRRSYNSTCTNKQAAHDDWRTAQGAQGAGLPASAPVT